MKISIITINLNNLAGLKRTRKSIIEQTLKDWEWIVIDGGSTNGDKEYIEEHQAEMSFWCSEPDKGVYNAMNKGIKQATGYYIIFMNSGDIFYNRHVLKEVFHKPQTADVLYGNWVLLYPDGHRRSIHAPKIFSLHFICRDNICHQAMFIKRSIMQQSPYDETFQLLADWAKWIELTLQKCNFEYVPYKICIFERGGISGIMTECVAKERKMLRTYCLPPAIQATLGYLEEKEKIHNYHPLAIEADRLIAKGKYYRKIIHMAIRLAHLLERI